MARPKKNNADYFPHVAAMRNDTRIKAVRTKFGLEGYAVYCMLLEYLSNSDFFEFKNDDLGIELAAGDFGIDPEKLTSIVQYFIKLDLIQYDAETTVITCKRLENYLEPLLSKRKRDRGGVIAVENPQSKVKESKEEKRKGEEIDPRGFDEKWKVAFDEGTLADCRMKFKHLDVDNELQIFELKCNASKQEYHTRDPGGLRLGFIKQLSTSKANTQRNGKGTPAHHVRRAEPEQGKSFGKFR